MMTAQFLNTGDNIFSTFNFSIKINILITDPFSNEMNKWWLKFL